MNLGQDLTAGLRWGVTHGYLLHVPSSIRKARARIGQGLQQQQKSGEVAQELT